MKNLKGKKFGRLLVLNKIIKRKHGSIVWRCICECGEKTNVTAFLLQKGYTRSCGCLWKEKIIKHGMRNTRFYHIWNILKQRCENPKKQGFKNYGGRGIKICKQWERFINFRDDMYKSYLEHVSKFGEKNTTIDRINTDGNYCKENCRWSTWKEQHCNRRDKRILEYNGQKKNMVCWAEQKGLKSSHIFQRLKSGWSMKKTLETPIIKNRTRNNFGQFVKELKK